MNAFDTLGSDATRLAGLTEAQLKLELISKLRGIGVPSSQS